MRAVCTFAERFDISDSSGISGLERESCLVDLGRDLRGRHGVAVGDLPTSSVSAPQLVPE